MKDIIDNGSSPNKTIDLIKNFQNICKKMKLEKPFNDSFRNFLPDYLNKVYKPKIVTGYFKNINGIDKSSSISTLNGNSNYLMPEIREIICRFLGDLSDEQLNVQQEESTSHMTKLNIK